MNKTIEYVHAVTADRYPLGWNTKNDKIRVSATKLLDLIDEAYVHVEWPETQDYMEQDWFEEEAVLDVDSPIGSCYFIPLARVFNL